MPVTLAIIGGSLALAQAGVGTAQYLSAKKQAKKNVFPPYSIQPEYQQNIDLLTNTLGLPSSVIEHFYNRLGQQGSNALQTALYSGANANDIAKIYLGQRQSFEDAMIKDALQTKEDVGNLVTAKYALAGEKDKAYQFKLDRAKDLAAAITQEKAAGVQNIGGAFNTAAQFAAAGATSKIAADKTAPPTLPKLDMSSTYADIARAIDTSRMSPATQPYGSLYFGQTPPNLSLDMFKPSSPSNNLNVPFGVYPNTTPQLNFGQNSTIDLLMNNPNILSLYSNPSSLNLTPFSPTYF